MLLENEEIAKNISDDYQQTAIYHQDDEKTPMATPSDLIEHLFCPRFTFFMHCLKIRQYEEKRYKVIKGREIHQKKEVFLKDYLRKKIGCVSKESSVYLANPKMRIRGIVDEVLHLQDGSLAPLDYKFLEYNDFTYRTHKVQSTLYALLIKSNYEQEVKKGFIVYCRSKDKVIEIIYKYEDFCYALDMVKEFFEVIEKGYYPKKTSYKNRCLDCCYKNICV